MNLKNRIWFALNGAAKSASTLELIGCDLDFLQIHLEHQFTPGMTWANHNYEGWHIDHIRPCASFDLTDPEQQKQCFNYTNLQPMWGTENMSKSAKYKPEETDGRNQMAKVQDVGVPSLRTPPGQHLAIQRPQRDVLEVSHDL